MGQRPDVPPSCRCPPAVQVRLLSCTEQLPADAPALVPLQKWVPGHAFHGWCQRSTSPTSFGAGHVDRAWGVGGQREPGGDSPSGGLQGGDGWPAIKRGTVVTPRGSSTSRVLSWSCGGVSGRHRGHSLLKPKMHMTWDPVSFHLSSCCGPPISIVCLFGFFTLVDQESFSFHEKYGHMC